MAAEPFKSDVGMLLLAGVLFPLHTVIMLNLWTTVDLTFSQLFEDGLVEISVEKRRRLTERFNIAFNSGALRIVPLCGGVGFTVWFLVSRRTTASPWGGTEGGLFGLASFAWISLLIWYQLLCHNLKGVVAAILAVVLCGRMEMRPRFLHEDGLWGLRGIFRCCYLAFSTSVIHTLAVVILWRFGYLPSPSGKFFLILALIFLLFFPLFVVVPLGLLSRQLRLRRYALLRSIRVAAEDATRVLEELGVTSKSRDRTAAAVADLAALRALREEVRRTPVRAFGGFRLLLAAAGYGVQLGAAVLAFYQVFFQPPGR